MPMFPMVMGKLQPSFDMPLCKEGELLLADDLKSHKEKEPSQP